MNKRILESIVKPLLSIFVVGLFLIGLVETNEVIETFKAKENYQLANYNTIVHYLEAFSEYELDDETNTQVLDLMCGIADETNANNNETVAIGVLSVESNQYKSNDENDLLLKELVYSIDPGHHKLKTNYDYFNNEYGKYRLIIRNEHEGIFNILLNTGMYQKLFTSSIIFSILAVILIIFFQNEANLKYRKIAGIIFIFIWLGSITLSSAIELNKQQESIVNDEVNHISSLIEFYYRQDLIEHGDEIKDRRQFAQDNIDNFKSENGNILNIELNENYHTDLDEIDGCLTITINELVQNNKRLEFILSSILFLILAIILYDKLSEKIMISNTNEDDHLKPLDKKIISIGLINLMGTCFTWAITLPRLMEVSRINFGIIETGYVSAIYSIGIIISTVVSILSSRINRAVRNVKTYFLLTYFLDFLGIIAFALIDDFVHNILAYFIFCFSSGMSNLLSYFYIAECKDSQREDSFQVEMRNALNIGQSTGIIIGGILGSVLRYRIVLLVSSFVVGISNVSLMLTNAKEYDAVVVQRSKVRNIKDILNKKHSFLFLLFIIIPLAFYDVYLDYKFPMDIINLGLTTAVISFVSMSGRLVSAYTANLTYKRLKNKFGLEKMTYIYLVGCIILMMIYQFNSSIIMIIIVAIAMGVLDSFGTLSYRRRFIEISKEENIAEDDGYTIVKVGDRLGTSIGPSLISLFNNAIALPIAMILSLIIYKLSRKKG